MGWLEIGDGDSILSAALTDGVVAPVVLKTGLGCRWNGNNMLMNDANACTRTSCCAWSKKYRRQLWCLGYQAKMSNCRPGGRGAVSRDEVLDFENTDDGALREEDSPKLFSLDEEENAICCD